MATIRRGKKAGEHVTIHQFCNDWVTVKESSLVYGVTGLKFDPEEVAMLRDEGRRHRTGVMFDRFDLSDDGIFTRRKP